VNGGVAGYNTVQEYTFLKTHVAAIDPDLVVLLYLNNDILKKDSPFDPEKQTDLRGKTPPKIARLIVEKSWLYRLARFALRDADPSQLQSFDKDAPGVKDSMNALAGISRLCQERNIEFDTFFYRERQESAREAFYMDQLFDMMSNVAQTHGFRVSDTQSWWGDADRRSVTISAVDWHPNARGHDILATGMAGILMTQDSVLKTRATAQTPAARLVPASTGPQSATSNGPSRR
jgi:hypothetical protein